MELRNASVKLPAGQRVAAQAGGGAVGSQSVCHIVLAHGRDLDHMIQLEYQLRLRKETVKEFRYLKELF